MAAILQADDLDAINRYVTGATIRTTGAQQLRDEWIRWFDGLSWGDRYFDRPTLDRARNKRLDFELANATSDAERAAILERARTGISVEEAQGDPDRRDSEGHYSEKAPPGPLDFGAKLALYGLGAAAVLALIKRQL